MEALVADEPSTLIIRRSENSRYAKSHVTLASIDFPMSQRRVSVLLLTQERHKDVPAGGAAEWFFLRLGRTSRRTKLLWQPGERSALR